jgi:hypothetical protein
MKLRGTVSLRRVVDTRVTDGDVFGKAVSCIP